MALSSRGVAWIPRSSKPGRWGDSMSVMWSCGHTEPQRTLRTDQEHKVLSHWPLKHSSWPESHYRDLFPKDTCWFWFLDLTKSRPQKKSFKKKKARSPNISVKVPSTATNKEHWLQMSHSPDWTRNQSAMEKRQPHRHSGFTGGPGRK